LGSPLDSSAHPGGPVRQNSMADKASNPNNRAFMRCSFPSKQDSLPRDRSSHPADPRATSQASPSHAWAASVSATSKYLILAIVNGLHTLAIHASHFLSPTRAMRSMSRQCLVENLMSSHRAYRSQPW